MADSVPDPIFAAIAACRETAAVFIARCRVEDALCERGIRLLPARGEKYRSAAMVAAVNAELAARMALATTVPATPQGLAAVMEFVREQSAELGEYYFDGEDECGAFAASIERWGYCRD